MTSDYGRLREADASLQQLFCVWSVNTVIKIAQDSEGPVY